MGLIYKLTSPSGKIYVGQTIQSFERRFNRHVQDSKNPKHNNTHLYKAFNKYGAENFSKDILSTEIFDGDLLDILEMEWIAYYKSLGYKLYNMTEGGQAFFGPRSYTDQYIKDLSERTTNQWKYNREKILNGIVESWKDPIKKSERLEKRAKNNISEKFRRRLSEVKRGENSNFHILKEEQVIKIISRLKEGETSSSLSKEYGVAYNTIWQIRNNKTWKYLPR